MALGLRENSHRSLTHLSILPSLGVKRKLISLSCSGGLSWLLWPGERTANGGQAAAAWRKAGE
jgi:hypothetical protein